MSVADVFKIQPTTLWTGGRLTQLLALLVGLAASQMAAAPVEYQVEGTVKHSWFNGTNEHRFKVSVQGIKWRIDLFESQGNPAAHVTSVGTDNGEDILHMSPMTGSKAPFAMTDIIVEATPYPSGFEFPTITHLWLVYASAPYFANMEGEQSDAIPKYAYTFRGLPREQFKKQTLLLECNEGRPRLPQKATFINRGWGMGGGLVGPEFRLSGAFEQGYVEAVYEAGNYRQAGNLSLPTEVSFKKFWPRLNRSSSNDVDVVCTMEARASSVADKISPDTFPLKSPTERFMASDRRIGDADSNSPPTVVYTRSVFPEVPTVKDLQEFQAAPRDKRQEKPRHAPVALRVMIGATVLVPLAIFGACMWRRKGRKL